jgi:hypothetical protein
MVGRRGRLKRPGQLADMPRRIRPRPADTEELHRQINQTAGGVTHWCDVSPMIADAQLNHTVAERHTTQVSSVLPGLSEAVEQVAAAVVEREQETPWQQAKFGVSTYQGVELRRHGAKICTSTGQARLRRHEHISHEFVRARREEAGRLDRRQSGRRQLAAVGGQSAQL